MCIDGDFEETNAAPPSQSDEQSNCPPLPPPDLDYLTRKPHVPLKWTPPNAYSSFVLEDNTVCYIGAGHRDEAVRSSFIDMLLGRKSEETTGGMELDVTREVGTVTAGDDENKLKTLAARVSVRIHMHTLFV